MIATDSNCLTADQLRDVAVGRLPADRFAQLMEHLEACPECRNRAETVEEPDEDSLAACLARPREVDPHAAEPDCVAALHVSVQQQKFSADRSAPPVDQLGPYRLIRPLGGGGMGAVFLARHTRLRRQCAVKLLPRDRGFDASWRDRFDREMAAVAALDDPHVVSATDAGEVDGWHYLVMEYLDGLDLSRLAARMGPLPVADACELVRQAAVGLGHIHAAGLVHRDIKPSNLMLTRDGVVKILDLGLVLSGTDPLPTDDRLTTVGQLMGTLAYMAPEQLVDSTTVDDRADLYALGATLYRLLAGTAPHGAARGLAPLVIAKTGRGAPPVTDHRSDLPAPLVTLMESLLDRDPDRRPESATTVAVALEPYAEDANPGRLAATALRKPASADEPPVSAPPLSLPTATSAAPPGRTWKKWIAAAAALPLLVLAGIAITIVTDRGQLVIESEAAGLDVSIEQGEEVVEQMELSTGENRITLRSGTYTVTMDAAADGLRLSDDTATVTRGDEAVLRVRREAVPSGPPVAQESDTAPRYQGETLNHWLTLLETERDIEAVIDAMQAVVALTKDARSEDVAADSDRAKAAAAMLRAARRYGGTAASGGSNKFSSQPKSPSLQFMAYLLPLYQALLPNPGLQAISHELVVGTPESSMAAIWLLNNYAKDIGQGEGYRPEFGELQRWSDTVEGRKKLKALSDHLDQAVERLGGYELRQPKNRSTNSNKYDRATAVTMAYDTRLVIDQLLGIDAYEDPAISDRLRKSVQEAAASSRRRFEQTEPPTERPVPYGGSHALSQWELEVSSDNVDAQTLAWAAAPSLVGSEDFRDREFRLSLLRRIGGEAPVATADAIVAILDQRDVDSGPTARSGMGGGIATLGFVNSILLTSESFPSDLRFLKEAVELVAHATTNPQRALVVLGQLQDPLRGTSAGSSQQRQELLEAVESAIEQLEARVDAE